MVSQAEEELGPIDYVVVEFPPGTERLNGAMAKELASLVDTEIIRVLDIVLVHKSEDGSIEVIEFEDLDDIGELGLLEGRLAEVLAAEDVEHLAAAMAPGSSGVALVWENTWAAPFAVAARESGGALVASGRIPTQALLAAVGADTEGN